MEATKKIIIAIDGHSSCGKSTLAKALAKALGYGYVDSGAMYRATTLYFLENQIDFYDDSEAVKTALQNIKIRFQASEKGNRTMLNGRDIEDEIRQMYISEKVSPVATISAVRREMVAQQRAMGEERGIVMDGRDIGTVVFPQAALKIFLTADPDVRAQRRYDELEAKGMPADLAQVKRNLLDRDYIDSTRKDSPLRKADDAIIIDNTNLTQDEQLQVTIDLAKKAIHRISVENDIEV